MENWFTPQTLIALFIVVTLLDSLAEFLNVRSSKQPLPASLQDLQSPADQARASHYLKDRVVLNTIKEVFFLIVFFCFLYFDGFESLTHFSLQASNSFLIQALIFGVTLTLGQGILSVPFSAYSTFKIEAQYGFNRTTVGTFVGDLLKGALVATILGGLIFSFVVQMLGSLGSHAWLTIWIGYTAFQFLIVWIAPITILPLFLKLTPLADGPLRSAIEAYSQKQSFKLDGAWISDASKRSAKSNAFFTGFGKFRRLVLFDTLIEKHPPSEIVAIVAHEAGHFKLGHIWKLSIFSALSSLCMFFCIQKMVDSPALYGAFGVTTVNSGIGLVLSFIVLNKILFFFSPIGAYFSRKNEYAADRFSIQTTGDAASLASGLKRLVTENLATLRHHPLYVILHDSHPPLPDRLKEILSSK